MHSNNYLLSQETYYTTYFYYFNNFCYKSIENYIYKFNNLNLKSIVIAIKTLRFRVKSQPKHRMKKLIIALDENTHKKAKIIALLKDITLNKFILDSIENAIKKDEHIFKKFKNGK